MVDVVPIRRALVSVSDKTGLAEFAQGLAAAGVEIISTGGSARTLREAGVVVKEVSEHTGFPEILDGRVKTLVPQIHGGILGRRDVAEHVAQMEKHGMAPIDLVVVSLYPFAATVAGGAGFEACVENIDIGGPALIRAAAKNHDFVAIVTEQHQYRAVLDEIARNGGTTLKSRRRLAAAASSGRFTATMPPNGEIGSQRNAFSHASTSDPATATPHGVVCFTITTAGASNSATHSNAASVSFRLL